VCVGVDAFCAAMASATNVSHVDLERLLVSCGYSATTARYIRSTDEAWRGPRLVSRTEAISKLKALLESKTRKPLVRLKGAEALAALQESEASTETRIEARAEARAEALAKALADLAGIANASMRMSPENLPSLVDTVACLTGRTAKRSAECAKRIIHKYFEPSPTNEVTAKIGHLVVKGCGQRPTPFPRTLEALVEFVLLIPGRKAAALRRKAASLIVRYYGGDERMIDEILEQRRVQVRMAEEEPDNPLRVFGQAVEEASAPSEASGAAETPSTTTARSRPPPPFRRTTVVTKFKGTTDEDLYVMELVPKSDLNHSTGAAFERPLYKIGKSKEVEIRRHDLALDFSKGFWVSTLLILKRCGDLEQSFHRRLQEYRCDVPRHRNGKELSKSREVFDLQKWSGEGEGVVVVTQLLDMAEDIVASLDSPRRSLGSQEEAEAKRRRCMDDLELEKEKTLQVMAEADARKAEAEARKAEAEANARKAEAEADARKAEAEAEARKAEARTRQLELLVGFGSEVQRTLVQHW
jgi:hypothetical protein